MEKMGLEQNTDKKKEKENTVGEGAGQGIGQGAGQGKMTIADVAEALNISKTTVSRAISGKGRPKNPCGCNIRQTG